ncbi:MAG: NUDIX hydrolase [Dehalococcoidia bacterium]
MLYLIPMKEEFKFCPLCGKKLESGLIENKTRQYCTNCDFVDYKNPLPVAVAVAIRDKKFLLIKRGIEPRKGMWGSASGFIESGESPQEACLRELREETGVSGTIVKLIGVRWLKDEQMYGDMLAVIYLVQVDEDAVPVPGGDVDDARFFTIDELPEFFTHIFKNVIEEVKSS